MQRKESFTDANVPRYEMVTFDRARFMDEPEGTRLRKGSGSPGRRLFRRPAKFPCSFHYASGYNINSKT
jgi:hypothetical protein